MSDVDGYEIIEHPNHYNWIEGVECMDVVKHFAFPEGTVIKHLWRAGRKPGMERLADLKKAQEYLWQAIWLEEERVEKLAEAEREKQRSRVIHAATKDYDENEARMQIGLETVDPPKVQREPEGAEVSVPSFTVDENTEMIGVEPNGKGGFRPTAETPPALPGEQVLANQESSINVDLPDFAGAYRDPVTGRFVRPQDVDAPTNQDVDPRLRPFNISEATIDERMRYALSFQTKGHTPKGWNAGEPTMCSCETPMHSIGEYAAHTWAYRRHL